MIVFASDLDNTLIYSYKREIGSHKKMVELYEGREVSFMTEKSYDLFSKVRQKVMLIPVSTRSIQQYRRISFPEQWTPEIAFTSNGGVLLRKGKVDLEWLKESKRLIQGAQEELECAERILERDEKRILDVRRVDGLFVFTKSSCPEKTNVRLKENLNGEIVNVFQNGCKVYVLPKILNKGMALQRLKKQLSIEYLIAAGDSLFDVPMLDTADKAYFPEVLGEDSVKKPSEKTIIRKNEIMSDRMLEEIWEGICCGKRK